jgi:hypothetical protein
MGFESIEVENGAGTGLGEVAAGAVEEAGLVAQIRRRDLVTLAAVMQQSSPGSGSLREAGHQSAAGSVP